jgi:hypothetical protein
MHPSQHLPGLVRFFLLLFLALFPTPSPSKTITPTFKSDDTSYSITFDDSKISESTIRTLIPLSPYVSTYAYIPNMQNFWTTQSSDAGGVVDKTLIAIPIEGCIKEDPAYIDCDNNSVTSPNFLRNSSVNLEKDHKGLAWLQNLPHPKELQPVVDYLVKQVSTSVWVEDARFRYYSTWGANVLKQKPAGLDAAPSCPDAFKELGEAKTKAEKYLVVYQTWQNCLNTASRKNETHPLSSWKSFLKNLGIQEKYTEQFPDD